MKNWALAPILAAMLLIPNSNSAATQQQSGAPGSTVQQDRAAATGAAEQAIKHLMVAQVEAWNRGDLEGFMLGYWHSPDLTFYSGATVTKGWEPTLARYRERYQSQGREMGKLQFQDLDIDMLNGKSAVVTGSWHLTTSDGKQPHGLFTLIVKRIPPAGWRIVHDHTSAAE